MNFKNTFRNKNRQTGTKVKPQSDMNTWNAI